MFRSALGVFRVVVVEAVVRNDFNHVERLVAAHPAGQLAAGDVALDHDDVAIGPVVGEELLRRVRRVVVDDEDAEARALVRRLHHIGRRHDVGPRPLRGGGPGRDSATGMPAAFITSLAFGLFMASAEASTPEWV